MWFGVRTSNGRKWRKTIPLAGDKHCYELMNNFKRTIITLMKHLIVNILTSLRKEVCLNVKALQHERSTITGRMTAENPERPQLSGFSAVIRPEIVERSCCKWINDLALSVMQT